MPNRTIYIRKEDIGKWDIIYTPEWLHEKVNETPGEKCPQCNFTAYSQGQVLSHVEEFHAWSGPNFKPKTIKKED